MKRIVFLTLVVALGAIGFFAAAGIGRGAGQTNATISLRRTALGAILVNSRGHTLYLFRKDRANKSSCAGSCASVWPPLIVHGKPTAGPNVNSSMLGTTRRSDGRLQATYNKHPLYAFSVDKLAGQTKGEGQLAFGARWFAVSARGIAVVKASSPAPTTSTGTTTTTCFYPPC
jgi:predicted lipoprotein with Yx(FWY)xxD motif